MNLFLDGHQQKKTMLYPQSTSLPYHVTNVYLVFNVFFFGFLYFF